MRVIAILFLFAACSPHTPDNGGGGVDGGDACTGSVTRCAAGGFEMCVDGVFHVQAACPDTCSTTLGCVQCDPAATAMTCNGNAVVSCNADGTFGQTITTCGNGMMCANGGCNNVCTADGVDLVYVVDEQNDFLSFDPRKLPGNPFTLIGTLACPTTGPSIQSGNTMVMPFSMSVDRDGIAWVLYTNGQLFKVSLTTAACTAAGNTVAAGGMSLFGMGFVTDAAGGTTEKLYLAGGNVNPATTPRKLGFDDTHGGNLTPSVVGNIAATADFSPELTGTSEAKLYGFFPRLAQVAYVQEVDKSSGAAVGMTWNLGTTGLGANINDWAFAQWGGVFYVFVTTSDASGGNRNSTVRSIDRTSSTYKVELQNLPYFIDGAGVSTCAPVTIARETTETPRADKPTTAR
jgi:hypothetical protein